MASNVPNLGGYDYQFVSDPPGALICLICTFVAKDPQQMDCCGKIYCRQCLTEHKKHSNKCPQCRVTGNSFNDRKSDRDIKALKIKCENIDNGCQWVGELGSLERHVRECGYTLLLCPNNCEKDNEIVKVFRKDLYNHTRNKCPRRQFKCPYCHEMGEHKERTGEHLKTCPQVGEKCPNEGCKVILPRVFLPFHLNLNCDYDTVSCKYAEVGCEERPLRKDLKNHEEDDQRHLRLMAESVLTLTTQVKHLEQSKQKVQQLEQEISRLTKKTFTFKLQTFSKKKRNNTEYYSSPFYSSSKDGYKMCIKVYVNGHGDGNGTHVSVFACLMKGDNDDSLTWPFTGSVTVELLNQLEDKNHHKKTATFTADNETQCSKRVVDGDRGTGLGHHTFIPHADLDHKPDKNCQYLKDDTLIYKSWLECTD